MTENKEFSERTETNSYPIVESDVCYMWMCPECKKMNHSHMQTLRQYLYIAECIQCERVVNVMEPKP